MGAGGSVLRLQDLQRDGYSLDEFEEVAGDFFSEELFDNNKNEYDLITVRGLFLPACVLITSSDHLSPKSFNKIEVECVIKSLNA